MGAKEIVLDIKEIITDLGPQILELVQDAESIYEEIGMGEIKKQWVLQSVSLFIDGASKYKDGAKEYKAMLLGVASMLIDTFVGIYNLTGAWGDEIHLDDSLTGSQLQ